MAFFPNKRRFGWACALAAAWLLCGCAALRPGLVPGAVYLPAAQAAAVMEGLERRNATLETFKGIGKIRIGIEGKMMSARVLWAGKAPDRLRMDILGLPGFPAASIALDGRQISFDGHAADRFYTRDIGDDSLKPILSVAVTAPDIMELVRGRLPIRAHTAVSLYRLPAHDGHILQLDEGWWGTQQRIFLNDGLDEVSGVEIFNMSGSLAFRADFDGILTVDGYQLPRRARLSNGSGDRFELEIVRYYANVPVDPSAFVLKPRP